MFTTRRGGSFCVERRLLLDFALVLACQLLQPWLGQQPRMLSVIVQLVGGIIVRGGFGLELSDSSGG